MVYMPHWPKPMGFRPNDYSIERVLDALCILGNPQKDLNNVIHVSGTNGKGSTLSFLKYILLAAGYSVNLYTSPHLIHFNERIEINGIKISDSYLFDIMDRCRHSLESSCIPLTFFEGTTLGAILAFKENPADFNLIEVGLGGRCDATNVFSQKLLSIITTISFDHMDVLGNTLQAISTEKAGIILENTPVIAAKQVDEVRKNLYNHAINKTALPYYEGIHWTCEEENGRLTFFDAVINDKATYVLPSLLGKHQIINAGAAIAASHYIRGNNGFTICDTSINTGLRNTYWPARLEKIEKGKFIDSLPDDFELYLDGAHNISGICVLTEWLKSSRSDYDHYLVLGVTKEKALSDFFYFFKPHVKYIIGVCVQSEPRSQSAEIISLEAAKHDIPTQHCASLTSAIDTIKAITSVRKNSDKKVRITVCGSLFLAGDMLKQNGPYNSHMLPSEY